MSTMKERLKNRREKTQRGGSRPGAGRKAKDGPTVRVYVRVPAQIAGKLMAQAKEREIQLSERLREILKAAVD